MSDDLSKNISELLDNKPISPEDELADALEDMARDIALIEPDPQDWRGWAMYFIDQLQVESKSRMGRYDFDSVLIALVNDIQDRIRGK